MKNRRIIYLSVLMLLIAASACKKQRPCLVMEKLIVEKAAGSITIRLSVPVVNSPTSKYWVCIVKSGSPDSEWGSWAMVGDHAAEVEIKFKDDTVPGDYEVRLHSDYPTKLTNVIDRKPLLIE